MGRLAILVLALASAACGGGNNPPIFPGGNDAGPIVDAPTHPPGDGNGGDGGDTNDGGVNSGPIIKLIAPEVGQLIAGSLDLEVDVTDDTSSITNVTATIAGTHEIMVNPGAGVRWSGAFDTNVLSGLVAPTVVVRAQDMAGQETELGFVITLDNQPPIAELDPPHVRSFVFVNGVEQCSRDFDPVGNDAPADGETVGQLIEMRGRVVDVGNTGVVTTTLGIPTAGVDRVQLYVFDDSTKPLVVDTDGDGICDAINPDIVPAITPNTSNEAAVLELEAIPAAGAAFFGSDTFGGSNASCTAGTATTAPAALCQGEPTSTKIIQSADSRPEIYGIPPVSDFNCLGFAFDARASNISDGFACAALLVTDNLGNRSVSPPLRICIDSDANGAECGALGSIAPPGNRPNCTGTVTGGVVTATPCTPRKYFRGNPDEFELIPD